MKVKEKIKSLWQVLKKAFEKFPVTIGVIAVFCLIEAICVDSDIDVELLEFFVLFFSASSLCVESIFDKINAKKIIAYIISLVLAIPLTFLNDYGGLNNIYLFRINICYIFTLYIISVLFLYKKSEISFSEYITKVSVNLVKCSVMYGILSIGIAMVSAIFILLILDGEGYELIARLEILLIGFYYFPKVLYSFVDIKDEVANFFKGLIRYALFSLVCISFVIIYLYIIKIIILMEMPQNQIFRILSMLFIMGMPIWTMMHYKKDDTLSSKISFKIPYAFIPFIFLQIYTLGIRINENGFTISRYLGIVLIIFEIIYMLIYIIEKGDVSKILIVGIVMILIAIGIPKINMFDVSNQSQANVLRRYAQNPSVSTEEKKKIYGAYQYLERAEGGEKYLNEILTKQQRTEIQGFSEIKYELEKEVEKYLTYYYDQGINIKGYSNLVQINSYSYYEKQKYNKFFKKVEFNINGNYDNKINVDMTEFIKQYFDGEEKDDGYFAENNEIIVDENTKIVLTEMDITYDGEQDIVKHSNFSGYMLTK